MKKPKKLLRKLLRKYQDELVLRPYSKHISEAEYCIGVLLEFLQAEKQEHNK